MSKVVLHKTKVIASIFWRQDLW